MKLSPFTCKNRLSSQMWSVCFESFLIFFYSPAVLSGVLFFSVKFVEWKGRVHGVVVTVTGMEVMLMEKEGRVEKLDHGGHRSAGSQTGKLWNPCV